MRNPGRFRRSHALPAAAFLLGVTLLLGACSRSQGQTDGQPDPPAGPGPYKVAYYAFDNGGLPLTSFANDANVVVIFEGECWEMADSVHYGRDSSMILTTNAHYHSYKSVLDDIRVLQRRGVKVLWNVDDADSWNTGAPFTDYKNRPLPGTEFAAFVKACIIDSLHLDGIALDVEHMEERSANSNFVALVMLFGTYFGPLSADTNTLYTAAIFNGAAAGFAIGQNPAVARYMNFVEDMAYFEDNTYRFHVWADVIGASKTMIGVTKPFNAVGDAVAAAQWQPSGQTKAGMMVYAANLDSSYTGQILRAVR